ncbi:MAG: recombination protein O N-terminal domain-containing protein [Candidatus Pacebacteria bacterium]|nr:recombination protein O N-terminal domain-containing protein [Candidatus Paceibacterota bacterium]MCF7856872.1 recombination protein O N-terminal domain-containing protein [Candidatus Paceibacterota bacterium]
MAYQTYITEALVCGSTDSHTADRSFLLFTREAGMIFAHAKSVREERSKQRYALQDCSHIRVTLIRGKSGWKIAGVESFHNFYTLAKTRETRAFLRNTIHLLRRVVHGETSYKEIFDDVISACLKSEEYSHKKLELVLFARILHALGYIASVKELEPLLKKEMPFSLIATLVPEDEEICREAIDHALVQSQL